MTYKSMLWFGVWVAALPAYAVDPQAGQNVVAIEPHLQPLMSALVEDKAIVYLSRDDVPEAMITRQARIGISSQRWTDQQIARFELSKGYRPTELFFSADVVALLVNEDNPVKAISIEEVQRVFGCHAQPDYVHWSQWKSEPAPYMAAFGIDGEFDMHREFNQWITCKANTYAATQLLADDESLKAKLAATPEAISYVTYSDRWRDYPKLSIIDKRGDTYDLNKETILSGRYPLASVYYLYLDLSPNHPQVTEAEKVVRDLALTNEHQATLNQYGFISLPEEAIHRNQVALGLATPIIEGGYK